MLDPMQEEREKKGLHFKAVKMRVGIFSSLCHFPSRPKFTFCLLLFVFFSLKHFFFFHLRICNAFLTPLPAASSLHRWEGPCGAGGWGSRAPWGGDTQGRGSPPAPAVGTGHLSRPGSDGGCGIPPSLQHTGVQKPREKSAAGDLSAMFGFKVSV